MPCLCSHITCTGADALNTCLPVQYLPSLLLLVVVVLSFALQRLDLLSFYCTGTYSGWLYLRFFQQQPDSELYGG